jgi:hypothetical protein
MKYRPCRKVDEARVPRVLHHPWSLCLISQGPPRTDDAPDNLLAGPERHELLPLAHLGLQAHGLASLSIAYMLGIALQILVTPIGYTPSIPVGDPPQAPRKASSSRSSDWY